MATDKIIAVNPIGFQWETQDPFIFCVHHHDYYPKGNGNLGPDQSLLTGRNIGQDFTVKDGWRMYHGQHIPGFPCHPHRGFETITFVKQGLIDHSDSLGAAGRYGSGDVQWMTAGKGIQHAEMFPLVYEDNENPLELFQIWLNLPKKNKFVEPYFKMLWNDTVPAFQEEDEYGKTTEVSLVAGELLGKKAPKPTPDSWASDPDNKVIVASFKMQAGASFVLPKSENGINRTLYFYEGEGLEMEDKAIPVMHSVVCNPDADIHLKSKNECFLLLLQGRPINEPVAAYGPFVMNTQEEIQQAYSDYRETQFGGWPWPNYEVSHGEAKNRFAKHADGKEEERPL